MILNWDIDKEIWIIDRVKICTTPETELKYILEYLFISGFLECPILQVFQREEVHIHWNWKAFFIFRCQEFLKIEITLRKAIFHRHRSYMLLLHIFQDRCMYQAHTFGIFGGLVGSLVVGLSYRIYSPFFDDKFHLLCNISLSNFQTCHLNIAFQVDSSNMDLFCNGNMVSLIHNFHLLCSMYPLVHTCFLFGIASLVNKSTLVHKLKFLSGIPWLRQGAFWGRIQILDLIFWNHIWWV